MKDKTWIDLTCGLFLEFIFGISSLAGIATQNKWLFIVSACLFIFFLILMIYKIWKDFCDDEVKINDSRNDEPASYNEYLVSNLVNRVTDLERRIDDLEDNRHESI